MPNGNKTKEKKGKKMDEIILIGIAGNNLLRIMAD